MEVNSRKLKVLIVSPPLPQQFVFNDKKILSQWYNVSLIEGLRHGAFKRLFTCVKESDFVLCWFGCRAAAVAVFYSRILRKKVAVIAGGQDVAHVPEINHGMMRKISHRGFIKFAFDNCDAAVAVSIFSAKELLRWTKPKAVCMIYNGVEIPHGIFPSESRSGVLCVARVTEETIRLKGIESLLKAANLLPHVPFTLVGDISKQANRSLSLLIPGNIRLTGKLNHESVLRLCSTSKVYVQPSYYESFGVALAESMAVGCVPVTTRRGALPEVVGDAGFYVDYGDDVALAKAINTALQSGLGERARDRVIKLFTLELRGTLLKNLIDGLVYDDAIPNNLLLDIRTLAK